MDAISHWYWNYNSKFVVIETLKNSQFLTVIKKFKMIFSEYGIPNELITDNQPEFISQHLSIFSKSWDFKHQTISYHQSNGLVEISI